MNPEDLCFTPATELSAAIRARKLSPVEIVEACDRVVTIPMDSALESLNASVAGSILMYALSTRADLGTPAPG